MRDEEEGGGWRVHSEDGHIYARVCCCNPSPPPLMPSSPFLLLPFSPRLIESMVIPLPSHSFTLIELLPFASFHALIDGRSNAKGHNGFELADQFNNVSCSATGCLHYSRVQQWHGGDDVLFRGPRRTHCNSYSSLNPNVEVAGMLACALHGFEWGSLHSRQHEYSISASDYHTRCTLL